MKATGLGSAALTIPRLRFAVAALRGKTGEFHDPTFRKAPYRYQPSLTLANVRVSYGWQAMRRLSTVARSAKVDGWQAKRTHATNGRRMSTEARDVFRRAKVDRSFFDYATRSKSTIQ